MTLLEFIRIIKDHLKWLVLIPITLAVTVYMNTEDMPKEYITSSMIYTGLASGYNIESIGQFKSDRNAIFSAFDNLLNIIKSRETHREVALRLLASHLVLDEPKAGVIGAKAYQSLKELMPKRAWEELRVDTSIEKTYQKLNQAYLDNKPKIIQEIFNDKKTYYSLKKMSGVTATRKGSSDLVEIVYSADDPHISNQTIWLMLKVFTRKFRALKEEESSSVVDYFRQQLEKAYKKLSAEEDKLTKFRVKERVLNYYEQTKFVAGKKEDITDEVFKLQGYVDAAQSVLDGIEEKLEFNREQFFRNDQILRLKNKLADINTHIALRSPQEANQDSTIVLKEESETVENELQNRLLELYQKNHTTRGINVKDLLAEWLKNLIELEVSEERLSALQARMNVIENDYDKYAPMGSFLKRLERTIDVYEREYLNVLNNLNQAMIRQKNVEMQYNLEIVDDPITLEQGSKRSLLVIIAFMLGGMGTLTTVVASELLDKTIKTPEKARRLTGLDLAGAYPLIPSRSTRSQTRRLNRYQHVLMDRFVNNMKMHIHSYPILGYHVIVICSNQFREGRSFLMNKVGNNLRKSGYRTLQLNADRDDKVEKGDDNLEYIVNDRFKAIDGVEDLIPREIPLEKYDYVIIEVPPLILGKFPLELFRQASLIILTVRANRSWGNSDQILLKKLKDHENINPLLFVNGVRYDRLDSLLGEVSYTKNPFKNRIKKLIRFEFKNKKLSSK